jgi:probable phosphoglycerate mutase
MTTYPQNRYHPPKGACSIILVRHGQTMAADPNNPFELLDGHGNPPLTQLGHQQAAAVANALMADHLDALYVTNLQRTSQTAAPLCQARTELLPIVEPDLREVFLGDWEGGLHRMHIAQGHRAALRATARQDWGEFPGAETTESLTDRVVAALRKIASNHRDCQVVVFVHGGVIAAALAAATNSAPLAFRGAENGSISRLVVQGHKMTLRSFNEVAHLPRDDTGNLG